MAMKVQAQYEAYPYPARDPRDEGEAVDHGLPVLAGGDGPLAVGRRAGLVAAVASAGCGGGTGDGLIQLAQVLTSAKAPYEITYLDLSTASRQIAEARAKARGLKAIRFHNDSLLNAGAYGAFDYIDCCGVLHHLPDPQAGFQALSDALAPGGGIGLMVYAPLGRSGVYPLQAAFTRLTEGMTPEARLARAKEVFAKLPSGHPFKCNPHLVDHDRRRRVL